MAEFNTIYVWIGASGGDWNDNVHNWTPGYPVAPPPGYGDLVIFNNGVAETVAGAGAASEADIVLDTLEDFDLELLTPPMEPAS